MDSGWTNETRCPQPLPGRRVDHVRARSGELARGGVDVLGLVRDVVHARAAAREEAADGRVLRESGDQLDAPASELEVDGLDALVCERAAELDLGAEEPPVRLDGGVEVFDGHRDVVKGADLHSRRTDAAATPRRHLIQPVGL